MKIIEVMKKNTLGLACSMMSLLPLSFPALAITDGELDGDKHPAVVLLSIEAGGVPVGRCSATLLSPTVVLTAGHCTGEPGDFSGMRVFTESDVDNGNNFYPNKGPNSVQAVSWASHPSFSHAVFARYDVGVVILEEPGVVLDSYPSLPKPDLLDELTRRRGQQETTFTAVGYGLQQISPVSMEAKRMRMYANPRLVQISSLGAKDDFSMLLSNNRSTGGVCFGDSGGPNFLGKSSVIAGVTSFGKNGNCAGTGGVFRLDRINVLNFIESYL